MIAVLECDRMLNVSPIHQICLLSKRTKSCIQLSHTLSRLRITWIQDTFGAISVPHALWLTVHNISCRFCKIMSEKPEMLWGREEALLNIVQPLQLLISKLHTYFLGLNYSMVLPRTAFLNSRNNKSKLPLAASHGNSRSCFWAWSICTENLVLLSACSELWKYNWAAKKISWPPLFT